MKVLVERQLTTLTRMEVREQALKRFDSLMKCTPFTPEERAVMESAAKLMQQRLELRPDVEFSEEEIAAANI